MNTDCRYVTLVHFLSKCCFMTTALGSGWLPSGTSFVTELDVVHAEKHLGHKRAHGCTAVDVLVMLELEQKGVVVVKR